MASGSIKAQSSNYVERYLITGTTRENILGNIDSLVITSGYYLCYIASSEASILGLSASSYFVEVLANSQNYRMLRATDVQGSYIKYLFKLGGVWETTWKTTPIT